MSTPYLGEIRAVGFNFPPVDWATCSGQSLAISQYQALFAVIGTTYGGDGVNTFNIPNLNGRVAVAAGTGPGLSNYPLGVVGGAENVTLTTAQMPTHPHPFSGSLGGNTGGALSDEPAGKRPGAPTGATYAGTAVPGKNLAANAVTGTTTPAGSSQQHTNMQPVLALNYIICLNGLYPPRN